MGGEIWVESEPGKGSAFIFTAKFGLARKVARRHLEPSVDLRGMRVLVVDDNASSREILQTLLESMSFEVTVAASAEEGIAELEKDAKDRPYKLVVIEWKMPGMDGIKASAVIKRHPSLPEKPKIIIATAYGREEVMQRSEKVGVDGFLLKPVGQSMLFDASMVAFGKEILEGEAAARVSGSDEEVLRKIRGAKVLLVEDNEINQQVAKEILEQAGLVVSIANNGQEALDLVRANTFDAVLMDVQMPVMDGYTATRTIRSDPRFHGLPIIAMTAHAMAGDHEKSMAAGMNDHVTKPIDPAQLLTTLARWIGAREVPPSGEEQPVAVQEQAATEVPGDSVATSPAEPAFPAALPGFDLAEGLQRLQDNKVLYRKLLVSFAAGYAQMAGDLRKVLDANDYDQAHHLVHSIKGVAGNLGARELQAVAMVLEKLVKHADESNPPSPENLSEAFAAFQEKLDQALQAARSLMPAESHPSSAPPVEPTGAVTPELAKEAALRLRKAADLGDVTALIDISEELTSRSGAFSPYQSKIAQLADDFDFDGILELVDDLDKIAGTT